MSSAPLNFSAYPQKPHGGTLVNQVVPENQRVSEIARARQLPSIRVDLQAVITIEMIATGVLSPVKGFMVQKDYLSVLADGRLADGTVWPVPLSFAPSGSKNQEIIAALSVGDDIALTDYDNEPVAILSIEDIFDYDKDHRAKHLFGTIDKTHPGVSSIYERMGDTALGGTLHLLNRVDWGPFEKIRMEPKDTWRLFYEEKKFNSVAGFITGANPLHRGHEYIHRNALEEVDAIFLQPLVEMAKREYVRHEYRVLGYRNVMEEYYPKERSILAPLRVTYIFAGPREAVLHALIMKNYGCTHALIGRDHAGIGDFYDKYAGHSVFEQYTKEELGIDVRMFHEVFFCSRCDAHATAETCPHDARYHLNISGTGIREMLRHGIMPPKEVVRPESALAAMQGVQPKGVDEQGESIRPVSKVINSIFPYYREYSRLGGNKRKRALENDELTALDLERACLDARNHAKQIYADVYDEYSSFVEPNRGLQAAWREEARAAMHSKQERLLSDLKEKQTLAQAESSDDFMYQNAAEVERELVAAKELFDQMGDKAKTGAKVWNALEYKRYRD